MVTFRANATTNLVKTPVSCLLQRIIYGGGGNATAAATGGGGKSASSKSRRDSGVIQDSLLPSGGEGEDTSGWGSWDDTKRTVRPATAEETAALAAFETQLAAYKSGDRTPLPPATPPVEEMPTPTAAGKGKGSPAKGKPAAKGKGKEPEPAPVPSRPSSATTRGKAATMGPPVSPVEVAGTSEGVLMVYARVAEPVHEIDKSHPDQTVVVTCNAVADIPKFTCESHQGKINFRPTYMLQSTVHRFTVTNDSKVSLPIRWSLEDIKQRKHGQRGTTAGSRRPLSFGQSPLIGPPFTVEPSDCVISPNDTKEFKLTFLPLDADDYVYVLTGETSGGATTGGDSHTPPVDGSTPTQGLNSIRMVCRGSAMRPVCHFELKESPDYLSRRPGNLKNEFGMLSPIECTDIKMVELESTGLRTRNTYRFHIINPTSDNYEFLWEAVGEPCPFWRCVQSAGMLFAGKRIEMVFEYLPDEVAVAEAFFKFKLANAGLEQLFVFAGKVVEPKVSFSSNKVDFHAMVMGGQGNTETVYLDNHEHLPFHFAFDRTTLLQLEGTSGPIIDITPKSGTVLPQSRCAIVLSFRPQEEVVYNFNVLCDVKRKPNKLSLNIKGEGYAVHPLLQLETDEGSASAGLGFVTLRPSPAVNYVDFGAVQINDTVKRKITISNNGKYNFDYLWDNDAIGDMLMLSGGKLGGTLQRAAAMNYVLAFSPHREGSLDGTNLTFTVAGKYVYTLAPRGSGVTPALRFSFLQVSQASHHSNTPPPLYTPYPQQHLTFPSLVPLQYDFSSCFVTSPGGSTVIEEAILRVTNHDPVANISIECSFQKTRALWVDCPPTMLAPGVTLEVPICFAPREVKDYAFAVPFVVNGTGKLNVNVVGRGALARLEMANPSQRKVSTKRPILSTCSLDKSRCRSRSFIIQLDDTRHITPF